MPAIPQPGAVAGQGGVPAAPTPPPLPAPTAAVTPAAPAAREISQREIILLLI